MREFCVGPINLGMKEHQSQNELIFLFLNQIKNSFFFQLNIK